MPSISLRLIESRAPASHRPRLGGPLTSVAIHAGVATLLVIASGTAAMKTDTTKPERVLFAAPPPPPPVLEARTPQLRPNNVTSVSALSTFRPLPRALTTPITIPDIAIDLSSTLARSDDDFSPERRALSGGGQAGARSGNDGAEGAPREAAYVEQPVLRLSGATPVYPEALRLAGIEGTVRATFIVDTMGRVEPGSFAINESSHALFTQAVERTIATLRFRPALAGGRKVRQFVHQPFQFTLH